MARSPLLVSVPPMLRIVPPAPPLRSTRSSPLLSRKVVTVFVPADLKRRSDESVIEFTVPIEAESDRRPGGYHDVRACARYASRAPVVRVVPIRTDGARPCRFAHDASPYPDCHAMPAAAGAAAGSDELHQRAGPAVGGEGEIRLRIDAGHQDIGGQTLASCRVSVPPVPAEFSTKLNVVADTRKFVASIVSPVPKPLIVAANYCACSRMSASAPVSLMVCPAETLESN